MMKFQLNSPYQPKGDQPQAIDELIESIESGAPAQTLIGVTGSGKTFTMANVIARLNRPTLIMSHNKTLVHTPAILKFWQNLLPCYYSDCFLWL